MSRMRHHTMLEQGWGFPIHNKKKTLFHLSWILYCSSSDKPTNAFAFLHPPLMTKLCSVCSQLLFQGVFLSTIASQTHLHSMLSYLITDFFNLLKLFWILFLSSKVLAIPSYLEWSAILISILFISPLQVINKNAADIICKTESAREREKCFF